jgi:undecaprenyl-diphosphatase
MDYFQAVVLGFVEGLTEFLPVSSTGHLTIAEQLLGLQVDAKDVTAFTAVIQVGAIAAAVIYFWRDIVRIVTAWVRGLLKAQHRGEYDYRMGWFVILGSVPIGIVGFLAKDLITGPLRSLWVVAAGLILWSGVMLYAERVGAYASIAWLLRFVAHNSIGKFVPYRVGLGVLLIVLLATGVLTAT